MKNIVDREILNNLYRYALTLTAHEANAFDLLQEVIERYIRLKPQADNVEHYLKRMLRNGYIDQIRKIKSVQLESLDDIDFEQARDDECSLESMLISDNLFEVIWNRLTGIERELLHFWAVDEMTAQEIALRLDVPRGTVLSRLHRLRKRLEQFEEIKQAYKNEVSL
jgi:RNA polymerase sigma-70 factor (ECF subfamily)